MSHETYKEMSAELEISESELKDAVMDEVDIEGEINER